MCSKIILLKCQDVTHINHFLIIVIKTKFGASWQMIFPAKQKLQKCIFGLVSLFFKKASFTAYFCTMYNKYVLFWRKNHGLQIWISFGDLHFLCFWSLVSFTLMWHQCIIAGKCTVTLGADKSGFVLAGWFGGYCNAKG